MTEPKKQVFHLEDYIDQEIDEYLTEDHSYVDDEEKANISRAITNYIYDQISNQITNAFI